MERQEEGLLSELEAFKKEEAELMAELERQRQLEEQLQKEEDDFWIKVAECQLDIEETEEERAATSAAIRYASAELTRLRKTNVLNEMFHISQDGPFGTINGFRMGRLPEQPVPWEEVNAAWGQACLLLDALVKKAKLPTAQSQYRLVPRGSHSTIKVGGKDFELYGCDGGLSSFWAASQFGSAMHAFLCFMQEVVSFLQRSAPLQLPFKIERDKVGGCSVKGSQFDQERWTKALKFLLMDLKYLIAVIESRDFAASRSSSTATS
ncbi:Atg6 [Symbiodinium natans]|uniref:Atg6 protein n=1 Tax=Symbiodinium natans TaxID=878477 RepID=A0A812RCQ5_9DINO|nr:Atg6 [Symbiodinium natans]